MTIDELAAHTGMTVRNLESYRRRGLLHPPTRQGRSAVYDNSHVPRVQAVRQLLAQGLNLVAIEALIARGNDLASDVTLLRRSDGAVDDSTVDT